MFWGLNADVLVPMHYESWDHVTQNGEGLFKEFEAEGVLDKVRWLKPGKAVEINSAVWDCNHISGRLKLATRENVKYSWKVYLNLGCVD